MSSKDEVKIDPTIFPDDREHTSADLNSLGTIMLEIMDKTRKTLKSTPVDWSAEAHVFITRSRSAEILTPLGLDLPAVLDLLVVPDFLAVLDLLVVLDFLVVPDLLVVPDFHAVPDYLVVPDFLAVLDFLVVPDPPAVLDLLVVPDFLAVLDFLVVPDPPAVPDFLAVLDFLVVPDLPVALDLLGAPDLPVGPAFPSDQRKTRKVLEEPQECIPL
ncbi:hypothetical protein BGZ57DRAFT_1008862 [Hyaloscypha finlandica]|nr:hypothetical protein BGZ57DRAFT_1008862 [Hyaloscypha finlandica]